MSFLKTNKMELTKTNKQKIPIDTVVFCQEARGNSAEDSPQMSMAYSKRNILIKIPSLDETKYLWDLFE